MAQDRIWTARVFILPQAAKGSQTTPVSALPGRDTAAPKSVTFPTKAQRNNKTLGASCPLLGVKRTYLFALHVSAYDPKRTYRV